jgi:hypothetical protein
MTYPGGIVSLARGGVVGPVYKVVQYTLLDLFLDDVTDLE